MTKVNVFKIVTLCIIGMVFFMIVGGAIADWYNHYVNGNKLAVDPYQTFNVAYIRTNDDRWTKVRISSWLVNSYETGCQVVTTNDQPIYTSFSNIILTKE